METKRIIEIFELIKMNIKYTPLKDLSGICSVIADLYEYDLVIDENEYDEIKEILADNKPHYNNEFAEFTKNDYWVGGAYWWYKMVDEEITQKIRLDYLTALIKKLTAIEN